MLTQDIKSRTTQLFCFWPCIQQLQICKSNLCRKPGTYSCTKTSKQPTGKNMNCYSAFTAIKTSQARDVFEKQEDSNEDEVDWGYEDINKRV